MIKSKTLGYETLEINYLEGPDTEDRVLKVGDIASAVREVRVPYGMSRFAIAAMFKGLHDHLHEPLGTTEMIAEEVMTRVNHNLSLLAKSIENGDIKVQRVSSIIQPPGLTT